MKTDRWTFPLAFATRRAHVGQHQTETWEHIPRSALRTGVTLDGFRPVVHSFFGMPWLHPDPAEAYPELTFEKLEQILGAIPPGVIDRQGSSALYPVQIPDLIGIKDRIYLDHSGSQRHRGPGDIMRYGALNQGMNLWASYGTWIPSAKDGKLPSPATLGRYSDEQLYALALFLYSLRPPAQPEQVRRARRNGRKSV
jgi:hypothetical protein